MACRYWVPYDHYRFVMFPLFYRLRYNQAQRGARKTIDTQLQVGDVTFAFVAHSRRQERPWRQIDTAIQYLVARMQIEIGNMVPACANSRDEIDDVALLKEHRRPVVDRFSVFDHIIFRGMDRNPPRF